MKARREKGGEVFVAPVRDNIARGPLVERAGSSHLLARGIINGLRAGEVGGVRRRRGGHDGQGAHGHSSLRSAGLALRVRALGDGLGARARAQYGQADAEAR
jgi:hypothetical protein